MFSRAYKTKGVTGLARYLKVYKVGDYVDVKVSKLPLIHTAARRPALKQK